MSSRFLHIHRRHILAFHKPAKEYKFLPAERPLFGELARRPLIQLHLDVVGYFILRGSHLARFKIGNDHTIESPDHPVKALSATFSETSTRTRCSVSTSSG